MSQAKIFPSQLNMINDVERVRPGHSHHNSVAINSTQYHPVISSTGSTKELKTVSSRVQKSKLKNKSNVIKGKNSPIHMNKASIHSDKSEHITMSQTGKMMGHMSPEIHYNGKGEKYQTISDLMKTKKVSKHKKTSSVSNYNNNSEAYSNKSKMNAFNQKPTYIILTIENSDEKATLKKETPKSSIQTLTKSSYIKQGQSYQQLSSLKKITKKKPMHNRTKSDRIIKSKPSINFKLTKSNAPQDSKPTKNLQVVKSKIVGGKSKFIMNPPNGQKVTHASCKYSSSSLFSSEFHSHLKHNLQRVYAQ
jgi:hypothetical protein